MDDELLECELCGDDFPEENMNQTFYWCVCDECRDEDESCVWKYE
jgi:hypothetical protein